MTAQLRSIDVDLDVHRAIERARLGLGESENDILRRLLLARPPPRDSTRPTPAAPASGAPRQTRRRGLCSVEVAGRRIPAANLADAYRILLRELAAAYPHFLEELAEQQGRVRRFVARTPAGLYGRSARLAARHARPLADGWYFDSNLSAAQVARRARIAARLCGLNYGSDVRILESLREI